MIIEIKNGKSGGDTYMQASRRYEMNTEALREGDPEFLACGAPAFICCLNDEELRICGAFKHGEQVVVEPHSNDLLYPDSRVDGRTIQLAQHLFALYSCLGILSKEIARYSISNPSRYIIQIYSLAGTCLQQTNRVSHACSPKFVIPTPIRTNASNSKTFARIFGKRRLDLSTT
ncbi:hypothetical protein CPB86DRAFT_716993 [Serendipita vermifera]|nr:hypothetical protein CPB86DRAFT_716993 [Serendipita vermifera]